MDEYEPVGEEVRGFLGEFLSHFADAARGRTDSQPSAEVNAGSSQSTDVSRETGRLLVKTAGDVFFHCSAQLTQVSSCKLVYEESILMPMHLYHCSYFLALFYSLMSTNFALTAR